MSFPVPESDLDRIDAWCLEDWRELRGARIFLTGGTGFIGVWLISSLLAAEERHRLGITITALTRSPDDVRRRVPELAVHPALTLLAGDVRDFAFPAGRFSHILHAAAEASAKLNLEQPLTMIDTIVQGTRRMLDLALACGAKRFLFVSSGAVYGRQPAQLAAISEDYLGGPDPVDAKAAYGEAKRLAEQMCAAVGRTRNLEVVIARCWAFVGPWLPLDTHFAVGNLLRDCLAGGPLVIQGDGATERSYLYAADLSAWLVRILVRGAPLRPYNVGSGTGLTIAALASLISSTSKPPARIEIRGKPRPGVPSDRYLPDVQRARTELALEAWTPLPEALALTMAWHRSRGLGAGHGMGQGR
jgi:nucleoside-diphosphate-sugar epimerase